ncbi:MAG: sporulation initiation factor Spo0A C-terminal domain-containing protein [Lachnospiraceae bacterium]
MNRELNIMLIEDDTAACTRFAAYADILEDISIVAVTNNSYRALELLDECVPDAVILDLELNSGKGNGLLFLQELQNRPLPFKPYVLVTTNNSSTVTYDYARQLGADFIMSKHQEDYSEKNAIDFLKMMKDIIQNNIKNDQPDYDTEESAAKKERRLTRLINLELDHVGISPKAIGYNYLTEAILLVINGETNNLSTIIGERHGKTNSSVERAMQNAINSAWRTNDIEDLLEYYTAKINSDRGVPTLTEFVYYYANKIKNNK